MKLEKFEFISDNLKSFIIEENICNYCDIGEANSSGLGLSIKEATPISTNISASNGSVSCNIIAFKTKNKKYSISVSNIDVKKCKK